MRARNRAHGTIISVASVSSRIKYRKMSAKMACFPRIANCVACRRHVADMLPTCDAKGRVTTGGSRGSSVSAAGGGTLRMVDPEDDIVLCCVILVVIVWE